MLDIPSLSTDQVAALVALAVSGSLRGAALELHISEQGVRNRLIALEQRLGVELYRKSRGIRRESPLTAAGRKFLPHARQFLDRSRTLCELFTPDREQEVHVTASHYLIAYCLIDVVRRFHKAHRDIRVKLSARTEQEVVESVLEGEEFSIGVAAPAEAIPQLRYQHWFSMGWSLIAPRRSRLLKKKQLRLADLADEPLIVYETGSTGRQHVLGAFQRQGINPRIEMEATGADVIVRMVEAGLGISIVPLVPSGAVTQGRKVGIRTLGKQIPAIDSGVMTRLDEPLSDACKRLIQFIIECPV